MSLYTPVKAPTASTVCDQCKKRKKSCSKTFPSCSRCSRLLIKCTYPDEAPVQSGLNLPPLIDVIPGLVPGSERVYWNHSQTLGTDEQVSTQASRLLNSVVQKRGPIEGFVSAYFKDFHRSLPIVDRDAFCGRLQAQHGTQDSHFSTLLLSMILISHLSSKIIGGGEGGNGGAKELYEAVKSMYSLLQSTGRVSVEFVQAGCIIAAWEHCQGRGREAWLSIGSCARVANVLGLHHAIQKVIPRERVERKGFETKRCLWWGIVVLEQIINLEYEHSKLPFAAQAPALNDLLPLVPGDSETTCTVSTDLITPDMTVYEGSELFNREFTRLGNFGSTIQATYLSSLVTRHITEDSKFDATREVETKKLDTALQSFACTLIPPPGMADGAYCGAFGLRTLTLFTLHLHSHDKATQTRNIEGINRSIIALKSLARIVIHMTKAGNVGRPLDYDSIAFWAHVQCAQAALVHIKFGERDEEWEDDLELLKGYLRWFEPRYGLFGNYLKEIEEAYRSSKESYSPHTVSPGTAMEC